MLGKEICFRNQLYPSPILGKKWFLAMGGSGDITFCNRVEICACFPQVECKAVMVFFHYCVMSNYFWLFIEGLYLFTLLVETFFPERRYFYWYTIIGWGRSLSQSDGRYLASS